MAVEGDLKDMNLINLIQMICQQGSRAALFLKRERERGMIYFDQGQVIHARLDALEGPAAIYRLLGWPAGTFRMSPYSETPPQTIHIPWGQLILEGSRLADEERTRQAEEVERVLSPLDIQQDLNLENNLTHLFSRLEQVHAQMAEGKLSGRPQPALAALAEMINALVAFLEKQDFPDAGACSLASVFEQVGARIPRIRLLPLEHGRLVPAAVANLYKNWSGDAFSRRQTFQQVAQGLVAAQEIYFAFFVKHFHATPVANQWQETGDVFLSGLVQVVDSIPF